MTAVIRPNPTRVTHDPGGLHLLILPVLFLAMFLGVVLIPGPPSDGPHVPPPVPATTSTTAPATTVTPATLPAARAQTAATRVTTSTMYCLRGVTASGSLARPGVVAVSYDRYHELLGTIWEVLDGPYAGRVFTVEDKGPAADFDMWTASCPEAVTYGRHTITIRRLEEA